MTAAELLEAAARAICRKSCREGGCLECPLKVETVYGPGQQACIGIALDQARAALLALLPLLEQPDEEMREAAGAMAHMAHLDNQLHPGKLYSENMQNIGVAGMRGVLAVLRRRIETQP